MSTVYPHLTPEANAAIDLAIPERSRRMLADRFITYDRLNPIFQAIDYNVCRPLRSRAGGLIVSGQAGTGKTMLARAVLRRFPSRVATTGEPATCSVVMINMSEAREAKHVYTRLLEALGCPNVERYTGESRRILALRLAKESALLLLVIDEIQDILIGSLRQQQLALEVIKSLMNELGISVLALGTPEAKDVMAMNQHLRARFDYYPLPLWKADDYLKNFLDALESSLPLKERSRLSSLGIMRMLVKDSQGVLTKIVERVGRAAALAVESGQEHITPELIERASFEFPKYARAHLDGSPS